MQYHQKMTKNCKLDSMRWILAQTQVNLHLKNIIFNFLLLDGMDECDTVAKAMECGKNTAPDIFSDIVTKVDLSIVV
jgi:hypothetical protein